VHIDFNDKMHVCLKLQFKVNIIQYIYGIPNTTVRPRELLIFWMLLFFNS